LCALTDGNLSRHLGVLTDAGLVEVWKGASGSRPQTMYRLTPTGRKRFSDYLRLLEEIVADAQVDQQATKRRQPPLGDVSFT
jgi:predicted ArsR family transcriptional regulator